MLYRNILLFYFRGRKEELIPRKCLWNGPSALWRIWFNLFLLNQLKCIVWTQFKLSWLKLTSWKSLLFWHWALEEIQLFRRCRLLSEKFLGSWNFASLSSQKCSVFSEFKRQCKFTSKPYSYPNMDCSLPSELCSCWNVATIRKYGINIKPEKKKGK